MKFSKDKHRALRARSRNQMQRTGDVWLRNRTCDKEDCKGPQTEQEPPSDVAVEKANTVLGCSNRSLAAKLQEGITLLYWALVRANLEYLSSSGHHIWDSSKRDLVHQRERGGSGTGNQVVL